MPARKRKAAFVEPMLLLRADVLPEGDAWQYELKFDGYRALAIKSGGKVQLSSRNDNNFNSRYPGMVKALASMPDDTVIDGEVVALDEDGRPSFNALQNYGSAGVPLHFFIFDLLILHGRKVTAEPLVKRRELIEILTSLPAHIGYIIIEHDMDVALRVVESVAMMHNGRVFKEGLPHEIEADPEVQELYLGAGHE